MTLLVALFLVIALSAYVLFGGADFGGGMLEATLGKSPLKKKLQSVIAPVWEANHVWLIAVVVILFVGFPLFYSEAMTRLYVPVSLALVGILIRGTAFSLRKYDPASARFHAFYTALFRVSSFATPLFFGLVVAGLLSLHPGAPLVDPPFERGYWALYFAPWLHPFGFVCGLFVSSLFAYLAAVFFYGELTGADEKAIVFRRVQGFFIACFLLGGATLFLGAHSGAISLAQVGLPQVFCQVMAALGIVWLLRAKRGEQAWQMRGAAGMQVLAILAGWFATQYPTLLRFEAGALTLDDAAAPPITQRWLVIGLVVVLAAVIPLLVQLYRVFQNPELRARRD